MLFDKGKVCAMTRDFSAPVEGRCLVLALREGSRTSVYLPGGREWDSYRKWVHFAAIDLRLKV